METVRRISALALVVALSLVGLPLPAHAGGEELPITLSGRFLDRGPLSDLLYARLPEAVASFLEQARGQLSGVLQDADGQPLADQRVELLLIGLVIAGGYERPSSEESLRLQATTDANGAFSYVGLGPGLYEVQYRVDGDVVASSSQIELAAGAAQARNITLPEESPGLSKGAKIWMGLGVGLMALVVLGATTCLFCGDELETPTGRSSCP